MTWLPDAVNHLRPVVPDVDGLDYFNVNYVSGMYRPVTRRPAANGLVLRVHPIQPAFPPSTWNVRVASITGSERTINERWNHSFSSVVGQQHPSLWKLLKCMQQDEATAVFDIVAYACGNWQETEA